MQFHLPLFQEAHKNMDDYTLEELVGVLIKSVSEHSERWILSDTIQGFALDIYPESVDPEDPGDHTAPSIRMVWNAGGSNTLHLYALGAHVTELKGALRSNLYAALTDMQRKYQAPRLRDALKSINAL